MPSRRNQRSAEVEAEAAHWFFQNSDDLFIAMKRGVVAWVNPAWERITGWPPEAIIGRPLTDFTHPDEADIVSGCVHDMQTQDQAFAEHRLRGQDGEWYWFRSRGSRPANGAALVVSQHITGERLLSAEREVKHKANQLLRTAAGIFAWSYNPDTGVYLVDPDLSRPRVEGGTSVEHDDGSRTIEARNLLAEIHPDDRPALQKAFQHTVLTGEQQVVSYRHWSPEAQMWATLRVAWMGVRQCASGQWEVYGITHDQTETAMARDAALSGQQAARAAGEAKAQFLANMSHEIRTPLNGVIGVLHLLKREPLSDSGRGLLEEALGCGSMLAAILNDIIDFSKIEAGRLELAPEPICPASILEGVANLLRPEAEAKGLYLRTAIDPAVGWVSIDPVRLRQVLFNLIGNAVKFTLTGGVEVRLSLAGEPQRLRIVIEDTGVGIAEEAQGTLFERFHQGDGSTTRRFGGAGLGLAITQRLAGLMDGAIGFSSQVGAGSTFWVELTAPMAEPVAEEDEAGEPLLCGLRVLVVEDNSVNRLIATRMLEHLGASVETAENGEQGVEAVRRSAFDLVFMDIQMPVMDGLEATRLIRGLGEAAARVPIIAMTANALAHQQASYITAGMNGSTSKPLSPAALVAEIAAVLGAAARAGAEAA